MSKAILEEYKAKRELYKDFSERIRTIVKDLLEEEKLTYVFLESRTKSEDSLSKKFEAGKLKVKRLDEIYDLSGIRVVTFVHKDVKAIEKVIKDSLDVKEVPVHDRLGTDRVGYRSEHWIVSLPPARLALREYRRFTGLKAELQIRTIVQHAWAQIGHDQVYKPSSILPKKIERDFKLLAGLLEVADNEFSRISNEIEGHRKNIQIKTEKGDLDIKLDTVSLRQFFNTNFSEMISEQVFGPSDDMAEIIIREFEMLNIRTLKQLADAIKPNFKKVLKEKRFASNYAGVARVIMITHDTDKYFNDVWGTHGNKWGFDTSDINKTDAYLELGVDITKTKAYRNA